jgi:hypothetical protein
VRIRLRLREISHSEAQLQAAALAERFLHMPLLPLPFPSFDAASATKLPLCAGIIAPSNVHFRRQLLALRTYIIPYPFSQLMEQRRKDLIAKFSAVFAGESISCKGIRISL